MRRPVQLRRRGGPIWHRNAPLVSPELFGGTERQSGPIRPQCTGFQNSCFGISTKGLPRTRLRIWGRCGVPCCSQGVILGAHQDPQNKPDSGETRRGTYLAQNGTARHPNCTGRLIRTLCAYSGGWAHQNYQSWWSLGHLGSGNLKTGVGATQGVFLKGVRPRRRPRGRGETDMVA